MANEAVNRGIDSSDRVEEYTNDRGIVPAETAARKEREGDKFKTVPTEERLSDTPTDNQTDADSIRTTDGYTVDREGLLNNYAVEPEMYYEVPGDARETIAEDTAERLEELAQVNQDYQDQLTSEGDKRGKGPGII